MINIATYMHSSDFIHRFTILILSSLVSVSCINGSKDVDDSICKIPLNLLNPHAVVPEKVSQLYTGVDYVRLQSSSDEMMINYPGRIRYCRSCFYIQDVPSHTVSVFSEDGDFIFKIDRRGRANGEYIVLSCFDVNRINGNIYIYDDDSRKIVVYSPDGTFIRNVQIEDIARDFAVLDNGDFVFQTSDYMEGNRFGIWQTDSLGHYKRHITPEETRFFCPGIIEQCGSFFHLNDCVCIAGNEENDYLYHIKSDTSYVAYKIVTDIRIPRRLAERKEWFDKTKYKGKIYSKSGYFESNDMLTIAATTDLQHFNTLYHIKSNGDTFYFAGGDSRNDVENDVGELILPPQSCYEGGFIAAIQPNDIDCENDKVQQFFPGVSKNDNPILVLMKTSK